MRGKKRREEENIRRIDGDTREENMKTDRTDAR